MKLGLLFKRNLPTALMAFALVAFATSASLTAAEVGDKIFFGSRTGMLMTVVRASGLNTARATILTKHMRSDAVVFCRDYIGKVTQTCIRDQLKNPERKRITANCYSGDFTNFYGQKFRFEGVARTKDSTAKYRILDIISGEEADGSSASGYSVNMGIFRALCPNRAPKDE